MSWGGKAPPSRSATGGSLYFTVLARQLDTPEQTLRQWSAAKAAAVAAIGEHHGTITHHHGVGRDHAAYLMGEIGELGLRILATIRATLDPYGILNPGVLLAGQPSSTAASGPPQR